MVYTMDDVEKGTLGTYKDLLEDNFGGMEVYGEEYEIVKELLQIDTAEEIIFTCDEDGEIEDYIKFRYLYNTLSSKEPIKKCDRLDGYALYNLGGVELVLSTYPFNIVFIKTCDRNKFDEITDLLYPTKNQGMYKFENLNQALIGLSKKVLEEGVIRTSDEREFKCMEIPYPLIICIENPTDRYINIPERKWSKVLGFAEAVWLINGTNHMPMVETYVPNMKTFSDDGEFMRAAYGPRIRAFSGFAADYKNDDPRYRNVISGNPVTVDQLRFVVESLQRDINTRQAEITIHDPAKDDFDHEGKLKKTKDTPCCRTLNFMVRDGKLDVTLDIRSNDLFWGLSAVNVFNFTFIQEYVANLVGVPVGKYYHMVKNLHIYTDKIETIRKFAEMDPNQYKSEFGKWEYPNFEKMTFEKFDQQAIQMHDMEKTLREDGVLTNENFVHPLFQDWAKVFMNYWDKTERYYTFFNPYLNKLFKFDMALKINNLDPIIINEMVFEPNSHVCAIEQASSVFFQDKINTTPAVYIDSILLKDHKMGRYLGKTNSKGHLNFIG